MNEIVLASASPRRKEILRNIKINFIEECSDVLEEIDKIKGCPKVKAMELARLKAIDVARNYKDDIVLGADTIVVVDDIIYGKPKNSDDAINMLNKLSGRAHEVITGVAVVNLSMNKQEIFHEVTKVYFHKITDDQIKGYLNTNEPYDKAGAYAIQGMGAIFIEKIEGCFFNVVGLPISKVSLCLNKFGINIF